MSDGIRQVTIKKKYIPGFCHNENCRDGHLFGQVINEIANLQRQDKKGKKEVEMKENKHIRILNRAKYWANKVKDCPVTTEGNKKSNRYLRHIRRLNRLRSGE